ncbi:MAG: MMPL family transporter [Gammaproteobacteria bacterium]|nr:MMPL family transporter [Gammaproteobacteria bacterium]
MSVKKVMAWVERQATAVSNFCFSRPLVSSLLLLAILAVPIASLSKITVDGSIEGFFKPDDPEMVLYNNFKRQFGQDGEIIVNVHSENVFTPEFLTKLIRFHKDIVGKVPHVEDITSLYNARRVHGNADGEFSVNDLLYTMPKDAAAMAELRRYVLTHPVYKNLLVSEDGKHTNISIKPSRYQPRPVTDPESQFVAGDQFTQSLGSSHEFLKPQALMEMSKALVALARQYDTPDFRIHVSGSPVVSTTIVGQMAADMPQYTRLSLLAIAVLLLVFTRRFTFLVVPGLIVVVTLLATFGAMAAAGVSIKPPTQVLLSVIIVSGICSTMHLLTTFFNSLDEGKSKHEALHHAISDCSVAIIFTNLTTVAGMISFGSSRLAPIAELGVFGSLSVLIIMVLSFTLVPVILRLFRLRSHGGNLTTGLDRWIDTQLMTLGLFSARHAKAVMILTAALFIPLFILATQVKFAHNALTWLPADHPARVDTQYIDAAMKGTVNLEMLIDTGKENGLKNVELLKRIDQTASDILALPAQPVAVGKTLAITDLLKEINSALHDGTKQEYRLPSADGIGGALFLFESSGSDDMSDFTDPDYSKARLTVRVSWMDAAYYTSLMESIKKIADERIGDMAKVELTGIMALLSRTSVEMLNSMRDSYIGSFVMIALMMMVVLGGIKLGLLSMIPNQLPVVAAMGVMALLSIPMDTFTILIGSIALGLYVDDTVHLFATFRQLRERNISFEDALARTIGLTGRPIVITALVIALGFLFYCMSSMNNIRNFGILMATTTMVALFLDLVLSPALLAISEKRKNVVVTDVAPGAAPATSRAS